MRWLQKYEVVFGKTLMWGIKQDMQYSIYLSTSQTREKSKCRAVKENVSFHLAASSILNTCTPFKASNQAVQGKKAAVYFDLEDGTSWSEWGIHPSPKNLLRQCTNKLLTAEAKASMPTAERHKSAVAGCTKSIRLQRR